MARRYVMVGSGPASIAAAEVVRSKDPAGRITIISGEPHGYYSRPGLAYFLADEVREKQLFPFRPEDFSRLDVQFIHKRAVQIDPTAHRVVLQDGEAVPYDRLLLATGARAIPLEVPGADLDGVVKLDDFDDARDLVARSRHAKAAVVVGGGITALEIVEGLRNRRVNVHYFMRRERYWSNVLSEAESSAVERRMEARGAHIHYFTELARVIGRNGKVVAAETQDGKQIPCDMVAVAIGVLPQKELAEAAGLTCQRGVVVDQELRSSNEDIFAAGDLAEVYDPVSERHTFEVLWSSAVEKGRVAGRNMSGNLMQSFRKDIPLNATRLAGLKITVMGKVGEGKDADVKGIARGDSETWRQLGEAVTVESKVGDSRIRLTMGENTIYGAVVMGDQTPCLPIQRLIAAGADVSSIRSRLLQPNAPVDEVVHDFWTEWSAHHA